MRRSRTYKSVLVSVLLVSVAALIPIGVASAKRPPGWDKGEKKGWTSDVPPGIEKKGGWMPPGLSKKEKAEWQDGHPPGWGRGRKLGWSSDVPPGWDKWTKEKRKGWQKNLKEAKSDLESGLISVEMAARKGVPIKHAKAIVVAAMANGVKGEGIEKATRAVAYGVGREVDFDQLGKYVNEKLGEGLKGDNLAIEIYKEVARCHEEKMKAKEAMQGEK